jgi:hypothetical protein
MKKIWLFPSIFGGIGIILFVITYFVWTNEREFMAHAKTTTGKVVSLEYSESSDGKGGTYHPIVEYSYNEKVTSFRSSSGSDPASYSTGEKVAVYFNPDNLQDAQIKSFSDQWLAVIIIGGIGFVFTAIGGLIGVIMMRKNKNKEYLLANGKKIDAALQSVQLNRSYSINGRNPYMICSQWLDTSSNTIYNFESDNIWFNPEQFIRNGKVPVYIDPMNPKKYYMDLSFLPQEAN